MGVDRKRGKGSVTRLSALAVAKLTGEGRYYDGNNLCLQITATGAKSWLFRYMVRGRSREMGLGALHAVSLADARDKAAECRKQLAAGVDPIDARKAAIEEAAKLEAQAVPFKQCAERYLETQKPGWKNAKHAAQWASTLERYGYPIIGELPVAEVTTAHLLQILEPIWGSKTETANRVRGRVETILSWSAARGYRSSENPARWRGHLDQLLPKRTKVAPVQHHNALPFRSVPAFFVTLADRSEIGAKALEFTILTVARTNEVILATGEEFKLDERTWVVPSQRMKAGREHRVPLSSRALELVAHARPGELVFPGVQPGEPMSNVTMLNLLKRLAAGDPTVHGFRSSFRDWAAETTSYANELCELALAHVIDDKTEAAYRRGDMFEKRRQLMADWTTYCTSNVSRKAEVIPFLRNA